MAYDENLAKRIRKILADQPGRTEKKIFGGLSFMLQGNMACGIHNNDIIVRIDPGQHDAATAKPYVRTFDYTGRPMKGWITVGPNALASDEDLQEWILKGVHYALSLPPK
ncbi:MAG: TfoX/Sxy family protein [Chloroflexi bacterium]|nr:TfoX/Sxy family protein [Chloroflexota bacterium]